MIDQYVRDDGPYVHIQWQQGPVGPDGANGAQPEEVMAALLARLQYLNTRLPDSDNDDAIARAHDAMDVLNARLKALNEGNPAPDVTEAIAHMEEAQQALARRKAKRTLAGVEGTEEPTPEPILRAEHPIVLPPGQGGPPGGGPPIDPPGGGPPDGVGPPIAEVT